MHGTFLLLVLSTVTVSFSALLDSGYTLQKAFANENSTCDCTNTNSTGRPTNPPSICNDARLGPIQLPKTLPLFSFVSDYDRFGGSTPGQFLAKWTDARTGDWVWPKHDGFSLDIDGNEIAGKMVLRAGTRVDRFGSENGKYVSAADAPFDQRSLPPASLTTASDGQFPYGYHVYAVKKDMVVKGGPIAPWFGQPGLGAQFYIGAMGNVSDLIKCGFLERLDPNKMKPGPGNSGGCGL